MRHQGLARIRRKTGVERVRVREPELDDAVDRQIFVCRGLTARMRSVEDQVLGVALNLGQSLHQEGVDIEPLGLELLRADICTPLQGRHALDERDTLGRRYDDVLERGYELESVNEAILILAKLSDSVIAVRSAQDDYHAARSPAPSLRHHRKPERQLALQTQQDDHVLTALATSPQLRPAPASRTSPTRLVAEQIKIEADRPIDGRIRACFGAIRGARAVAICTSTNRTLKVFSPYFAISKPAQQLGLVSKFPLL